MLFHAPEKSVSRKVMLAFESFPITLVRCLFIKRGLDHGGYVHPTKCPYQYDNFFPLKSCGNFMEIMAKVCSRKYVIILHLPNRALDFWLLRLFPITSLVRCFFISEVFFYQAWAGP